MGIDKRMRLMQIKWRKFALKKPQDQEEFTESIGLWRCFIERSSPLKRFNLENDLWETEHRCKGDNEEELLGDYYAIQFTLAYSSYRQQENDQRKTMTMNLMVLCNKKHRSSKYNLEEIILNKW